MESKFKVGDKVRIIKSGVFNEQVGDIAVIEDLQWDRSHRIRFKKEIGEGRNWMYRNEEAYELFNDKPAKITIKQNDLTVTATLKQGKSIIKSAKAMCNPSDTFEFGIGAELAVERLFGAEVKEEVKPVKFKVGDRVRALKDVGNKRNTKGEIGTIKAVSGSATEVTVEFDNNIIGHRGQSEIKNGKDKHCWYLQMKDIELVDSEVEEVKVEEAEKGDGNFKVKALKNFSYFTKGKIYDVVDGYITYDDGTSDLRRYDDWNDFEEVHVENGFELITTPPITKVSRPAKIGEWVEIVSNTNKYDAYYEQGKAYEVAKQAARGGLGCFIKTEKTHPCNCGEGTSYIYLSEYIVLENYQPPQSPIDLGIMPADGTLYATVEVAEIDYSKIDYTKLDGHRLFEEVKRRVRENG